MYHHHYYLSFVFFFSILCNTIQLLKFEKKTNAHNIIKVTILQHTISYIFRTSLAHNQEAHNCKQQVFICSARSCCKILTM